MIGILKAFLGLSASAYITIYVSFLEPDALRFLLVLAVAPTAVALLASPFINYVPFIQIEPHTKVCVISSMFKIRHVRRVHMRLHQQRTLHPDRAPHQGVSVQLNAPD